MSRRASFTDDVQLRKDLPKELDWLSRLDESVQELIPTEKDDLILIVQTRDIPIPDPVRAPEGEDFIRRSRELMMAAHAVLRLAGSGGVSVFREAAQFQFRGTRSGYVVDLPYRRAWALPPYVVDKNVRERLRQLFSLRWHSWRSLPIFTRFAEAVYRYSELDRWIDFMICLEALLVPDGQDGTIRYKFAQRAALFFPSVNEDIDARFKYFGSLYDLRSKILHGEDPSRNTKELRTIWKTLSLNRGDWTSLARSGDDFVRKLHTMCVFNDLLDPSIRGDYWRAASLRGRLSKKHEISSIRTAS